MNILELAKECGMLDEILIGNSTYRDFSDIELQAFAQAVIEDYKAGLVPVAIVNKNTSSWYLQELVNVFKLENGTPLFALPTSSKNELPNGETK